MKLREILITLIIVAVVVWGSFAFVLQAINASVQNDSRHIRTFDNTHTLVWKDTLWRLEPVELDKAQETVINAVDTVFHCNYADSALIPLTWNFSNIKADTLWYDKLIKKDKR